MARDRSATSRSSSPTPQSDDDDDDDDHRDDGASVASFTSTSPPSPTTKLWSTRAFRSASQPVTPSVVPKSPWSESPVSPRTASAQVAFLKMTPSRDNNSTSSESRYKKLFHKAVPLPTIRSQNATPESGEPPPAEKKAAKFGLRLDMSNTVRKKRRSLSTGLQGLMPPNKQ